MISKFGYIVILLWPALSASAARLKRPDPMEALSQSLVGSSVPYQGEVKIQNHSPQSRERSSLTMEVSWAGLARYHREMKDKTGNSEQIIIADGTNEWLCNPSSRKAWKGPIPINSQQEIQDEVRLISANYSVKIYPGRRIAGRPTWLLELRSRATGNLARRILIDRQYWVSLENELFEPNKKIGSSMRFASIAFNPPLPKALFEFHPPAGWTIISRASPQKTLPGQHSHISSGRDLPSWLPSGYAFESEDAMQSGKSPVWHDRFSDGINVLSLFQYSDKIQLDFGATASQPVSLASRQAQLAWTQDGLILSWSHGGKRFVLIGPVGLETIEHVAESVP